MYVGSRVPYLDSKIAVAGEIRYILVPLAAVACAILPAMFVTPFIGFCGITTENLFALVLLIKLHVSQKVYLMDEN